MDKEKVRQWIMDKFLDWQKQSRDRKSVTEFSAYLGIGNTTVTKWLNGDRTPRGVYIEMVARKLGDEIYELVGTKKKDRSSLMDSLYEELLPEQQEKVDGLIRKFAEQNVRNNAEKRASGA